MESCGAQEDCQGHSTNLGQSLLEACDVCKESDRTANLRDFNPTRTHFRLLMCEKKKQAKQHFFVTTCTDDQATCTMTPFPPTFQLSMQGIDRPQAASNLNLAMDLFQICRKLRKLNGDLVAQGGAIVWQPNLFRIPLMMNIILPCGGTSDVELGNTR